jgi:C-terminal processing protease CtpA/Prc
LSVTATLLLALQCGPQHGTIGALLAQRPDGTIVVRDAPPNLAAAQNGIEPGDELLLIDGRDVRPMTPKELHRVLSGSVGEPVKLTLVRGDRVIRVHLRRSPIPPRPKRESDT